MDTDWLLFIICAIFIVAMVNFLIAFLEIRDNFTRNIAFLKWASYQRMVMIQYFKDNINYYAKNRKDFVEDLQESLTLDQHIEALKSEQNVERLFQGFWQEIAYDARIDEITWQDVLDNTRNLPKEYL